mmetsp:Transcript_10719/g.32231  ORF Transcript_10719/g.32231 Transcript_10719/m.32231 type:complete len:655 (+) Transcript_10719:1358-3322(+)
MVLCHNKQQDARGTSLVVAIVVVVAVVGVGFVAGAEEGEVGGVAVVAADAGFVDTRTAVEGAAEAAGAEVGSALVLGAVRAVEVPPRIEVSVAVAVGGEAAGRAGVALGAEEAFAAAGARLDAGVAKQSAGLGGAGLAGVAGPVREELLGPDEDRVADPGLVQVALDVAVPRGQVALFADEAPRVAFSEHEAHLGAVAELEVRPAEAHALQGAIVVHVAHQVHLDAAAQLRERVLRLAAHVQQIVVGVGGAATRQVVVDVVVVVAKKRSASAFLSRFDGAADEAADRRQRRGAAGTGHDAELAALVTGLGDEGRAVVEIGLEVDGGVQVCVRRLDARIRHPPGPHLRRDLFAAQPRRQRRSFVAQRRRRGAQLLLSLRERLVRGELAGVEGLQLSLLRRRRPPRVALERRARRQRLQRRHCACPEIRSVCRRRRRRQRRRRRRSSSPKVGERAAGREGSEGLGAAGEEVVACEVGGVVLRDVEVRAKVVGAREDQVGVDLVLLLRRRAEANRGHGRFQGGPFARAVQDAVHHNRRHRIPISDEAQPPRRRSVQRRQLARDLAVALVAHRDEQLFRQCVRRVRPAQRQSAAIARQVNHDRLLRLVLAARYGQHRVRVRRVQHAPHERPRLVFPYTPSLRRRLSARRRRRLRRLQH